MCVEMEFESVLNFYHTIHKHVTSIFEEVRQRQWYYNPNSIGLDYSEMRMSSCAKILKGRSCLRKECRNMMLLSPTLIVEFSDMWRFDFVRPLTTSNKRKYILVAVDYESKRVEAAVTWTNNPKVVIIRRFGTWRSIISS